MLALPHHIELLSSATPANISYPSMMGLTAGMLPLLSLALIFSYMFFYRLYRKHMDTAVRDIEHLR